MITDCWVCKKPIVYEGRERTFVIKEIKPSYIFMFHLECYPKFKTMEGAFVKHFTEGDST